ncbi:hypothetical protein D3C71_19940 [compost metagenome]
MHQECAEYALRVCPYLALPRAKHGHVAPIEGVELHVHEVAMDSRPERFFLGISQDYQLVQMGDSYLVYAHPWQEVVWQPAAK